MSCLFRALSAHISGVSTDGLRQKICDHLAGDPSISGVPVSFWVWADKSRANEDYTAYVGRRHLQQYVNEMRRSNTWGGAIEIISFCHLFRARIRVYDIRRRRGHDISKAIHFEPKSADISSDEDVTNWPMYAIEWSGGHYEPVSPGSSVRETSRSQQSGESTTYKQTNNMTTTTTTTRTTTANTALSQADSVAT